MPLCKLCLKDKKLIDAHIVPAGFYRYLYPDLGVQKGPRKNLVMVEEEGETQQRPIGEYDKNILCAECDQQLGTYDEYAQEIILRTKTISIHDEADSIKNIDYPKLKLFFISLLWRASISDRYFFHKISLGPFEEIARSMLLSKDPGDQTIFPVIFTRFRTSDSKLKEVTDKNITIPLSIRLTDGARAYIFYLPMGYKIYIKVDKRELDSTLEKLILSEGKPVTILNAGNFENSQEFKKLFESLKKARDSENI